MPPPESSARINTANIWKTISPSDSVDQPKFRALYVVSDGNINAQDAQGNTEIFPVTVGQIVPIQPTRIFSTSTTATLIGLN